MYLKTQPTCVYLKIIAEKTPPPLDGYVSAFDANVRQSFVLKRSVRILPMVDKTLPIICCHPLVSMYMPTTRARQRNSENLLSPMKRWQLWIKKFYCIFTRVEKKENFDKKFSKNFPKIFQNFFQKNIFLAPDEPLVSLGLF